MFGEFVSGSFRNLRALRKALDLTQEEMAEKFKINGKTYSAYETGRIGIPPSLQKKFVKAGLAEDFEQAGQNSAGAVSRDEFLEMKGDLQGQIRTLRDVVEKMGQAIVALSLRYPPAP